MLKIYVIDGECSSKEAALKSSYEKLEEEGCVTEFFLKGCLEREREFPTGLPTEIPVAIPHTLGKYVKRYAICLVRFRRPVSFFSMEDPDMIIMAEYMFNMALRGEKDQLKTLQKIMKIVSDKKILKKWKNESTVQIKEEFERLLSE